MKDLLTVEGSSFGLDKNERTAVFIETANFQIGCRHLGFRPDFTAFKTLLEDRCEVIHLVQFRAVNSDPNQEVSATSLIGGYLIFNKIGQIITNAVGHRKAEGADVKLELATHIIETHYERHPDRVVLVSSSPELSHAVNFLRRRGVKTTIVASPKAIGDAAHPLIVAADQMVSLLTLKPLISLPQAERRAPAHALSPA